MFQRAIEKQLGQPLTRTDLEFALNMATMDIKENNVAFNKKTSMNDAVGIAVKCLELIRRCA